MVSRNGNSVKEVPKYCVSLDDEDVATAPGRFVGDAFLVELRTLVKRVGCRWSKCLIAGFDSFDRITLVPKTVGASSIELYIYRDTEIGVAAGEGAYFNVPGDTGPSLGSDTVRIVMASVRAIMEGKLVETVYSAGRTKYRYDFTLDTEIGQIALQRVEAPKCLVRLLRGAKKRTVKYRPFSGGSEGAADSSGEG